jgi:plastocyanin
MRLAARSAVVASLLVAAASVAAPAIAADGAVSIVGKAFEPATITINQGDTVTWTVTQSIGEPHSVTSGTPEDSGKIFDSGTGTGANMLLRDNGQTFEHAFTEAGEFLYYCSVHPADMTGKVVVLAEGASPPPSVEPAPSEQHTGVPAESRILAGVILGVSLVLMFAMAWLWRRMNPA